MKMCDCNQGRLPCTCKPEPAEQHQGEPVAIIGRDWQLLWFSPVGIETLVACCERTGLKIGDKLYRHPDSGEVERLRERVKELEDDEPEWSAMQQKLGDQNESLRAQLAERDALLREAWSFATHGQNVVGVPSALQARVEAALSASAEPSAAHCQLKVFHLGTNDLEPVERDERAEFDSWFRKEKGLHPETDTTFIDSAFCPYRAWKARAALERKP